jgi:hypothetical protein
MVFFDDLEDVALRRGEHARPGADGGLHLGQAAQERGGRRPLDKNRH